MVDEKKYPVKAVGPRYGLKNNQGNRYLCFSFVLPRNVQFPEYGFNIRAVDQLGLSGGTQIAFLTENDAKEFARKNGFTWAVPYKMRDTMEPLIRVGDTKLYLRDSGIGPTMKNLPASVAKNLNSNKKPVMNPLANPDDLKSINQAVNISETLFKGIENKLATSFPAFTIKNVDIQNKKLIFYLNPDYDAVASIYVSPTKSFWDFKVTLEIYIENSEDFYKRVYHNSNSRNSGCLSDITGDIVIKDLVDGDILENKDNSAIIDNYNKCISNSASQIRFYGDKAWGIDTGLLKTVISKVPDRNEKKMNEQIEDSARVIEHFVKEIAPAIITSIDKISNYVKLFD